MARGFQQRSNRDHSPEVYSPVVGMTIFRLLCAHAAEHKMRCISIDVRSAYLMTPMLHDTCYVSPPPGVETEKPDHCWQLNRYLYGLPYSAKAFYLQLSKHLKEMGMVQSRHEECLFKYSGRQGEQMLCIIHVDDLFVCSSCIKLLAALRDSLL